MPDAADWPLADLRVVELSRFVGAAYAGKLFAELGADVIAVEPAEGHPLRRRPIRRDGPSGSLFDYLFTNKRVARIGTADAETQGAIRKLAHEADVVVSDGSEVELETLFEATGGLVGLSERRIVARIKPFVGRGSDAPSTYFTAYHAGGEGYLLPEGGARACRPARVAQYSGEYDVGLQTVIATLAAQHARQRGRIRGEHIEISVQGSVASLVRTTLGQHTLPGVGPTSPPGGESIGRSLPCRDGQVEIAIQDDADWFRLAEVVGRPEWAYRQEFADPWARFDAAAEINARLADWTRQLPKAVVRRRCQAAHVACGSVETIDDVLDSPQLAHRQFFRASARGGQYPGLPFTLADGALPPTTEWVGVAADADLHWRASGCRSDAVASKGSGDPTAAAPLAGVRVVEFSSHWAVPFSGMLLAALGAEVIKIESRTRPDPMRLSFADAHAAPDAMPETSVMYHDANLGKRSLTLDLAKPEGRALAQCLVKRSDVVMQSYSVGVMERLGLGPATLRRANPAAIVLSETASGEDGPTSHYVGYAAIFAALSGLAHCTGHPEAPAADLRESADLRVAATCTLAVLSLLHRRNSGGTGEFASVSAVESLCRHVGEALTERSRGGAAFERNVNEDPLFCPNNTYPCRGTKRFIALSICDDSQWQSLRELAAPALDDPRLGTAAGRRSREAEIDAILGAWTRDHDAHTLSLRLGAAGVPARPVGTAEQLFADPVLEEAGFLPVVDHTHIGKRPVVGLPWEFRRMHARIRGPAPLLGEANTFVLEQLLGVEPARVEQLKRQGVIQ